MQIFDTLDIIVSIITDVIMNLAPWAFIAFLCWAILALVPTLPASWLIGTLACLYVIQRIIFAL